MEQHRFDNAIAQFLNEALALDPIGFPKTFFAKRTVKETLANCSAIQARQFLQDNCIYELTTKYALERAAKALPRPAQAAERHPRHKLRRGRFVEHRQPRQRSVHCDLSVRGASASRMRQSVAFLPHGSLRSIDSAKPIINSNWGGTEAVAIPASAPKPKKIFFETIFNGTDRRFARQPSDSNCRQRTLTIVKKQTNACRIEAGGSARTTIRTTI
jgi:hypothetical protein